MSYAHRGFRRTQELFERAQRVIPGGINGVSVVFREWDQILELL